MERTAEPVRFDLSLMDPDTEEHLAVEILRMVDWIRMDPKSREAMDQLILIRQRAREQA